MYLGGVLLYICSYRFLPSNAVVFNREIAQSPSFNNSKAFKINSVEYLYGGFISIAVCLSFGNGSEVWLRKSATLPYPLSILFLILCFQHCPVISLPHFLIELFLLLRERHERVVEPTANVVRLVVRIILIIGCNYPINIIFRIIPRHNKSVNQFRHLHKSNIVTCEVCFRTDYAAYTLSSLVLGIYRQIVNFDVVPHVSVRPVYNWFKLDYSCRSCTLTMLFKILIEQSLVAFYHGFVLHFKCRSVSPFRTLRFPHSYDTASSTYFGLCL